MCRRETAKKVKSVIIKNYTTIIYDVDPKPVIRQLRVSRVFSVAGHDVYYEELQNMMKHGETDADVNERLLKILFKRENWWIPFIKALRECGADEIAKFIEAVLPWNEKQKLQPRRQQKIACSTPRIQHSPEVHSSEDGDAVVTLTLETAVRQVPVGVLNIFHKLDTSEDWEVFAGLLSMRFTMDSLDEIDDMTTASKTKEVIKKFARVEGKMATFGRMISALQKMQRRDLLDEIEEFAKCRFSNKEVEDDVGAEFKDAEDTPADNRKTSQAGRVAIEHEDNSGDEDEVADDSEDKEVETCLRHGRNESGDTKDETRVKKASDAHVDDMSTEGKKRQEDCMRQTTHHGAADGEVEMKDIQTRDRDDTKMRQLDSVEDGFGSKICLQYKRSGSSVSSGLVSFTQNQTVVKGVPRDQSVPKESIYSTTAMGYHHNNSDKSSPPEKVRCTQPNDLEGPKVNTRHREGETTVSHIHQNVPAPPTGLKMPNNGKHYSSAARFNNVNASQTQPKEKWSPGYSPVPQPVQHPRSHIKRFSTHYEEQDVPLGGLNGRDQTLQETVSSSTRPPQTRNTLQCQNPPATLCSLTNTFQHYYEQAPGPDLKQTSNGSFYLSYLDSSVVQEPSCADYRNVPEPVHIMSVSLPSVPPSCHERQAQTALQQSMYPNANTEYELVTPRPCKENDDIPIDERVADSTAHGGPRAPGTGAPPESSQSPDGRAETAERGPTSSVKNCLKTVVRA